MFKHAAASEGPGLEQKRWRVREGTLLASIGGVVSVVAIALAFRASHAEAVSALNACQHDEHAVGTQVAEGKLRGARLSLSWARGKCPETELGTLTDLDRTVSEAEHAATEAEAARLDAAAGAGRIASEEKERALIETFPTKANEITANSKRARVEMNAGRWVSANSLVSLAEADLAEFDDTSVKTTKEWSDLNAAVVALRQKLQPQLDRIAVREDAERRASASSDAERGPEPKVSAWDGSVRCVERYLKETMNDPGSYQHVSSTAPVAVGPSWIVVSRFRAKNGFGALTVHQARFEIQRDQVVDMEEQ
jgi:hypothetical protein